MCFLFCCRSFVDCISSEESHFDWTSTLCQIVNIFPLAHASMFVSYRLHTPFIWARLFECICVYSTRRKCVIFPALNLSATVVHSGSHYIISYPAGKMSKSALPLRYCANIRLLLPSAAFSCVVIQRKWGADAYTHTHSHAHNQI